MDLKELESYRLSDAIKFNDHLNPKIWGSDEQMLPEVREKLLAIAEDFKEFLGVTDLEIKDITVSGSNAAYTYTPHSDIDLHLVADLPKADTSEVYRELFDAKKYQYNDQHDFKIGGYDVELYVQNANEPAVSQGIYSVLHDQWISVPKRRKPKVDDISVKSKYEDLGHRIEQVIESGDLATMDAVAKKVRALRQAGLEQTGEFGPENLAFKILRSNGTLDKLRQARLEAKNRDLSLAEREKTHERVRYGFAEQLDQPTPSVDVIAKKHGVSVEQIQKQLKQGIQIELEHTTDENRAQEIALDHLNEIPDYYDRLKKVEVKESADIKDQLAKFVKFTAYKLGFKDLPRIKLKRDPAWSKHHNTFGRYVPEEHTMYVSVAGRHIIDVMRTIAHELTHHRQHQEGNPPDNAGDTGSHWENEANAMAGVIMREWNNLHPEMFSDGDDQINEIAAVHSYAVFDASNKRHYVTSDLKSADRVAKKLGMTVRKMFGPAVRKPNVIPVQSIPINTPVRESSGYIPVNAEEARDPRYSMALTVDIKPGETQRQAAKLGWKVDAAGVPPLLMKLQEEFNRFKTTGIQESVRVYGGTASQGRGLGQAKSPDDIKQALSHLLKINEPTPEASVDRAVLMLKQRDPSPTVQNVLNVLSHLVQRFKLAVSLDTKTALSQHIDEGIEFLGETVSPHVDPSNLINKAHAYVNSHLPDEHHYPRSHFEELWDQAQRHVSKMFGGQTSTPGFPANLIAYFHRLVLPLAKPSRAVTESEELLEVNMSPGNLKKWIEGGADGIRAGFEAELIFRDTQNEDDNQEQEPDYDQDRRARSIEDIVEFFGEGDDYNGRHELRRLKEKLDEQYIEWRSEKFSDEFYKDRLEIVKEYMDMNVWDPEKDQRIRSKLEENEYSEEDIDRIMSAGENAPMSAKHSGKHQQEYADTHKDYQLFLDASESAYEDFEEEVEEEVKLEGPIYEDARQYWNDMSWDGPDYDDEDFVRAEYPTMSDVLGQFDIMWPYWTGGYGYGSRSTDEIAESLSDAVGMPVKASSSYHGAQRREGLWIIEPDSSLEPDDASSQSGLEIVSPPLPLKQALQALKEVMYWADHDGDAYTNDSTGLHMGVSVANQNDSTIDYIKLVLFLGDQHILEKFGRSGNTYCQSAYGKLKDKLGQIRPELNEADDNDPVGIALGQMRNAMMQLAQRELRGGVGNNKYTSVHDQGSYIEFRSPGGDYLGNKSIDDLEHTMMRFARALSIAADPNAERKEYGKKLYKLLTNPKFKTEYSNNISKLMTNPDYKTSDKPGRKVVESSDPFMKLFAQYSAGEITGRELKDQWVATVADVSRKAAMKQPYGQKAYELYNYTTMEPLGIVYGTSEGDAIEKGIKQVPTTVNPDHISVGPVFPKWDIYNKDTGEILRVIRAHSNAYATNLAMEYFSGKGINFDVRAHTSDVNPTRREKLAKQLATAPRQTKTMGERIIDVYKGLYPPGYEHGMNKFSVDFKYLDKDGQKPINDTTEVLAHDALAANDAVIKLVKDAGHTIRSEDVSSEEIVNTRGAQERQQAQQQTQNMDTPIQSGSMRWAIQDANTGEVLYTFWNRANQGDANQYALSWMQRNRPGSGIQVEVNPVR